ncbi:NADH dehydrogenase subunit E [Magnetococcus marinus MC-1]|uniref:NADH dehydrogenase subunit E n=1 Tax=Magnetococcus marinus (strain ATCC BAA-1437 / JCM 17883 / MC-1) TaxID=156889 RepID=A0LDS3_MAGMM|nr:NADH-quinone oxidoreductase subunit NuoE [Magnetococcus marinus]ABK46116.1 NADH dehydrogenase subunit E [Magnetococcus marinus MC-1]
MSEIAPAAKPAFSQEALKKVETIYNRYPADKRQSALLPVLDLAQREFGGWLSRASMDYVAELMGLAPIRVYEVATFYTMYNLKPVGKHHVQVCTNISCWLCGSDGIGEAVKQRLEIEYGQTTEDGNFTLSEVECLGACVNAPMFQINDDYYENLTPETAVKIIDELANKA